MNWRTEMLPQITVACLVPCGADKAPLEKAWQQKGYTQAEIAAMGDRVKSVGINTAKANLVCIDLDGPDAFDFIESRRLPLPETWVIGRNTDPNRMKRVYRVRPDQQARLPVDRGKWKKGSLEVFWRSQQFIVMGDHPSGGYYTWDNGPETLADLPDEWIEFLPQRDKPVELAAIREIDLQKLLTKEHSLLVDAGLGGEGNRNNLLFALATDAYAAEDEARRRAHGDIRIVGTAQDLLDEALERTDLAGMPRSSIDATLRSAREGRQLTHGFEDRWAYCVGKSKRAVAASAGGLKVAQCKLTAACQVIPPGFDEKGGKSRLDCGMLSAIFEQYLGDRLRYNLLGYEVELDGRSISDNGRMRLLAAIQNLGYTVTDGILCEALLAAATLREYHPVREYLHGLGGSSLDSMALAAELMGQHDMLQNVMLQRFLVGAVARALEPGCKMDYVCILHGKQGEGKSEFWRHLFGPQFYQSYRSDKSDKDSYLALHGSWGIELAEFDNLSNRDAASLKNFVSTASDYIRRPYGRKHEMLPRPSVFPGTCNTDTFLRDHTGERRYWVIDVPGKINIERVIQLRDSVWAAVLSDYRRGDKPFLPDELAHLNEQRNEEFREQSTLYHQIRNMVRRAPGGWLDKAVVHEQMAKLGLVTIMTLPREIKSAMLELGWTEDRARTGPARGPRYWRRNKGLSEIEIDILRKEATQQLMS